MKKTPCLPKNYSESSNYASQLLAGEEKEAGKE